MKAFLRNSILLLFCILSFFLSGCAGSGGGNPAGQSISAISTPGTSIKLAIPGLASNIQASSLGNYQVSLYLFDPAKTQSISVLTKTAQVSSESTNIEFSDISGVVACAEIKLGNMVIMESNELCGAMDIVPYQENVLPLEPKGTRSPLELAATSLLTYAKAEQTQTASENKSNIIPSITLIKLKLGVLASDSATIYNDAYQEFTKLLGNKRLQLKSDSVYPFGQIEITAVGFTPSSTSYQGFIDNQPVTFYNQNAVLSCQVSSLSAAEHSLRINVDGMAFTSKIYGKTLPGNENSETIVNNALKVFETDIAEISATASSQLAQEELQSLKTQFSKLQPAQRQTVGDFISANAGFFEYNPSLSSSAASRRPETEEITIFAQDANGNTIIKPNIYQSWQTRYCLDRGLAKNNILKERPKIPESIKTSDSNLVEFLGKLVKQRLKNGARAIEGFLRKIVFAQQQVDEKSFVPRKLSGSGVRGSIIQKTIHPSGLTGDFKLENSKMLYLEMHGKARTLSKEDFYNGNPDFEEVLKLGNNIKSLEQSINQGSTDTTNFSVGIPNLSTLSPTISAESYPLSVNLNVSTKESIAKSISNPNVRLKIYHWHSTETALGLAFESDELGDQSFTFSLDYQMPGFPVKTVTVSATITTAAKEFYDAEETKVAIEGHRDSNGTWFGNVIRRHPNGSIGNTYQARRESGKALRYGTEQYFNEDGTLARTHEHNPQNLSALGKTFYTSGEIESECQIIFNEGLIEWTDENDNKHSYLTPLYNNAICSGTYKTFYKNRQTQSSGQYSEGKKTGMWQTFYENGQIQSSGQYSEGKKTGRWELFTSTGKLSNTEEYDDLGAYSFKSYDSNSRVVTSGQIDTNGRSAGLWTFYTYKDDGSVITTTHQY